MDFCTDISHMHKFFKVWVILIIENNAHKFDWVQLENKMDEFIPNLAIHTLRFLNETHKFD